MRGRETAPLRGRKLASRRRERDLKMREREKRNSRGREEHAPPALCSTPRAALADFQTKARQDHAR
ncbi:hypothetical protein JCGZ_08629 [Jatropha curcas]|uniref:Uncharacterized protein n=1 Tax=Jatropha curcas TaxID=180498 RepID=A0A067J943_JATCU|nr:hypothetical protein JCGZ_08629 [Jatropha curcas]